MLDISVLIVVHLFVGNISAKFLHKSYERIFKYASIQLQFERRGKECNSVHSFFKIQH